MDKYVANTEIVLIAFLGSFAILEWVKRLGIKRYGFIDSHVYTHKIPLENILRQNSNIIWNDEIFERDIKQFKN